MDSPDPIPLQEAVDRGLIPCSSCGKKGADVARVGDKNHFLCAKCARGGSAWTWILAGLTFAVVALVVLLLKSRPDEPGSVVRPPPPPETRDPEPWMKETTKLLKQGRFREVRERTQELLDKMPDNGLLNLTMGRCLLNLGSVDLAIPPLQKAMKTDARSDAVIFLGMAYKKIGHAAEALACLEKPFLEDASAHGELADVYVDLERYDDALKLLSGVNSRGSLWSRHRALVYSGRLDEAAKILEGRDEDEVASLRAGQLREAGDFAGALKIIETQSSKVQPGSSTWNSLRRAERSIAVESGDLARVDAVATSMDGDKDRQIQAEGAFTRSLGHLMAGRREPARAAAWEFLAKADKESSTLRLERMMMRHLVGELKDADLDSEARLLSRFHANDVLWYLALAGGGRGRAEQALAATPGHNYPYHAIQRLLKK